MGFFSAPKAPKPKFFEGQKDIGNALFQPGGPIYALLHGGPDAGYESGVNRGMQQLNQGLASQGIFGSALGGSAASNYLGQAATGREQNRLQTLLSSVQPYGTGGQAAAGKGYTASQNLINKFTT